MQVKTLRQRNPDRSGDAETDRKVWAGLYEAGRAFRDLLGESGARLLPQAPMEPRDDYTARRDAATYAAHPATVIDGMAGALLESPPLATTEAQGDDRDAVERLNHNADGAGHSLSQLVTASMVDLATQGEVWLCADAPGVDLDDTASEADRQAALRSQGGAYVYRWDPLTVLDYAVGRDGRLLWVLRHYTRRERASAADAARVVHVWEQVDRERVTRWEWAPPKDNPDAVPQDEDVASEVYSEPHGRDVCPVIRAHVGSRLHAMGRMRDPAVRAFRLAASLDWRVYRESAALLAMRVHGADDGEFRPLTGTGAYLMLRAKGHAEQGDESAEFIAPPVGLGAIHAEQAAAAVGDVYRVVSAMALSVDPSASKQRQSADAQREQFASLDKLLLAYGETLRDALQAAVDVWATWEGMAAGSVSVVGLDSYRDITIDRLLTVATLAAPLLPGAGRGVLAAGIVDALRDEGVTIDDETYQRIQAQIEAGELDGPAPILGGL